MDDFIQLQDTNVSIDLQALASLSFVHPTFRQLSTFSISSLIYFGNFSSLFRGKVEGNPAIIETCTRIPYIIVCREYQLLNELNSINNIVKITHLTRNPSQGIVSISYQPFEFIPWTDTIPNDSLPKLLLILLNILKDLHRNNVFHGWICRSSIYVTPNFESLTLGSFHASGKVGEAIALTPNHPCAPSKPSQNDKRADDIFSAALWFISFYKQNPQEVVAESKIDQIPIDQSLRELLKEMTKEKDDERITAEIAADKLHQILTH